MVDLLTGRQSYKHGSGMGESERRRPPRRATFAATYTSPSTFGSDRFYPGRGEASSSSAFGYPGPMQMRSVLIVFAGLPGTGKSSVARELDRKLDAVWSRIDSIEQAIRDSAVLPGSIDDAGYRAAFAVAGDNLRLGRAIVADSVASGRPCGRG